MSEPAPESPAAPRRWRNPIFLLVFVPGAVAWLTVVGWLTWLYFNPVTDWVGRQNMVLQEILGTVLWVGWAVTLAFGLAGAGALAERAAGLPPVPATQTHGRGTWHKPH